MTREEKLAKLRRGFSLPENGTWDPEAFLLQLGLTIKANTDSVKEAVDLISKSEVNKNEIIDKVRDISQITKALQEMTQLQKELAKAITEHRIEKVEVERIRELPPSKFKIEVEQKDAPLPETHRNFFTALFTGAVKTPIDGLTNWFSDALDFIRTPKGAIAVKLVDKNGDAFYNAIFTAVSSGVSLSMANVESILTSILSVSSGWDVYRSIDIDETEEEVKATAGRIGGWYFFNAHTATLYLKIYNATAANVIVGTTTPRVTIPIPSGSAANVMGEQGILFDTAITIACTTGLADNDTGAPAANMLIGNLLYK